MTRPVPSVDPADQDSMIGLLRTAFDKFLQNTDDMLPARVVTFDRAKNRATVQPLIRMITTNGETLARPPVASIPVVQMGGGGMVMLFNLKAGDLGWIKANDRDISLFLQSYGEQQPNTLRKHSFSDAVFIPDVMRGWTLAGEDAANAVLQTKDGSQRVSIWPDRIKLSSGPVVSMTISATGIAIVGNVSIVGGITQTGGGGAGAGGSGASFVGGTITHDGINIGKTHVHPQGPDSAGNTQQNTGGPQ